MSGTPASPQRVLDGEVLDVLLDGVVQGAHLAVLPQLVEHQGGEELGEAGDPDGGGWMDRI